MIGKIFNERYKIIEKLGSGGTSIVYRGQDLLLNRMVTIKILREEYVSNSDFVRRFRHEAQAVASLSHSNIVGVYDVGFEENMHYIVMEFVEGESLKDYIRRRGVIPYDEACSIICQILSGLQHAHDHGIIHRDIKSHNILLSKDGRAKVTDFGIAVGMSDVTLTYNTSSRIMGSVHYISPEQVQGQSVTEKSDIYSVGVIMYEMLTGRLPFLGETPISIAMQHVQGELAPVHQINPKVPMGISYVVMRAMRKNPETRFSCAKEMSDAVHAAYEGSNAPGAALPHEEQLVKPAAGRKPAAKAAGEKASRGGKFQGKLNGKHIALLAGAAVLLVIIVWVVASLIGKAGNTVEVPYVVGDSLALAQEKMEAEELILEPTYVYSNEPIDIILSQSVEAGTEVSRGRSIGVTVSKGEETVAMPLLEGATRKIAELTLKNRGFTQWEIDEQYDEEIPKDVVIMQSPVAETQVLLDVKVELIVSLGPEPDDIAMPNLLGMTLEQANPTIVQNDFFVAETKYEENFEYAKGLICAQSIAPNTPTQTGAEITITVSNGPGPQSQNHALTYTVPDDDKYHHVIVEVSDGNGKRDVFDQVCEPGLQINSTVSYFGKAVLTIYMDDEVVHTEELS